MHPVSPDTVLAQLQWRYATKKFDATRKIAPELWAKLEQATVLSPSSFGLQLWKFVVVTNPEVRQKLHPVSWNQPQILDASHLVVFAAKNPPKATDVERHIARIAEVRGVELTSLDPLKDRILGTVSRMTEKDAHNWAARQCYIALGVFLSTCALAGVDACPMEGFQPEKYDEILGLKAKGYGSVVIATAGYRHPDDPAAKLPKARFALNDVIEHV
ncbi:MAG: NAD(P)H-dependent oxidoreductase [Planctomycetaceae bacterium]|nr:NAD(P)H-dependent oxidoreductase [Planctomycetaceae bacterium]